MVRHPKGRWLFSLMIVAAILGLPGSAVPQGATEGKFSGEYLFYGGTLDDRALPTAKDTKLSVQVSGAFAAQLFRRMGGAAKPAYCGEESHEWKELDQLLCIRERSTGKVDCHFGFDMRSGKSIGGLIC